MAARQHRPEERTNEYFLDGEGISREVIQADICRYLGNDALVRQGTHQGRHGYVITAYRNLTSNMISDLKTDSARWEHDVSRRTEQGYSRGSYKNPGLSPSQSPNNVPGNYVQSSIHDGRQQVGPSQGFTSGPPPTSYEPVYTQPPPSQYGSVPSNQGYSMPPYQQNLGYAQNAGAYPPQSQSPYNPSNQSQPPSAPDMHPSYTHHGGPGYQQYAEGRPRFTGQGDEFEEYTPVASGIPYATTAGMPYPTTTAPDMRMDVGYPPDPYREQVGSRPRDSRRGR